MAPLRLSELEKIASFREFCENADFLALSLALQEQFSRDFSWENEFLDQPLELSSYFPESTSVKIEWWDQGVLFLEPRQTSSSSMSLVLSVGIHGNETAPIELINKLLTDIFLGNQECHLPVLILFGHLEAMIIQRRHIEENLNRCFHPDKELSLVSRSQESTRAYRLSFALDRFVEKTKTRKNSLFHLDLHTAIRDSVFERFVVYPHQKDHQGPSLDLMALMKALGIQAILCSDGPTTTFSYYSSEKYGAQSLTVELGKVRPFGENDHSLLEDVRQCLEGLLTRAQIPVSSYTDTPLQFDVVRTLTRRHQEFKLTFPENLPNFSKLEVGSTLMIDGAKTYTVHNDQERIVFPNSKVEIGERAVLIVMPK